MNTIRTAHGALAACLVLALGAACQKHEFPPPDRDQRILDAETLFSGVSFDSITWESDSARMIEGNIVYASTCRRCHGTFGEGGTEYASSRDLDVPSLVLPDWHLSDDVPGIRHSIFVGHAAGMPTFGVATLSLRDIDAASWYVVHGLRPDLIAGDTAG